MSFLASAAHPCDFDIAMTMTKSSQPPATHLSDPRLAAGALLEDGARLADYLEDGDRLVFVFEGLSPTFVKDVVNGDVSVCLRSYIAALEHIQSLMAQWRARRRLAR